MMTLFDLIGLFGVLAYVSAYALLQLGKLNGNDGLYLLLNAIGSVLILISLTSSFNLPSFVAQAAWLMFTVIGFLRTRSAKFKESRSL